VGADEREAEGRDGLDREDDGNRDVQRDPPLRAGEEQPPGHGQDAEQTGDRGGEGRLMSTVDEKADEVDGHGAHRCGVGDERDGEAPEPPVAHRGADQDAALGCRRPAGGRRAGGRAPHDGGMQGDRDGGVDGGEDEQGGAPAVPVLQETREGHEDGAGEPRDDDHAEQGGGASGGVEPGDDDGGGGLVEGHRHGGAEADEHQIELPNGLHL